MPVTPSASLALAEVTVPAAASVGTGGIDWANGVFDRRRPTVAIGGVIPQSWGDNFDGAYPGQFRDTGTHLERWDGTAWQPYARQLGGIAPAGEVATGQYVGQYRDEGGRLERWDGTVWRPATPGPAFAHHTDGGHASSTTYVDTATDTTGPTVVATFVAPVSGSALVTIGFIGFAGSASGYADISARIRQGSTMILEAVPERAARIEGTAFQTATTQFPVTGLQPGTEYTATLCYRTSSDDETGWYDNRFVRVDPML